MRRASLTIGLLALCVAPVFAQNDRLEWRKVEVFNRLDDDGRAEVDEVIEIAVAGKIGVLYRSLYTGADQRAVVHGVFLLGPGEAKRPLRSGPISEADSYEVYFWGIAFSLRAENDPPLPEETRRYLIQYSLENAIAPSWDIPAGPLALESDLRPVPPLTRARQILAAWERVGPEPERKYRFDHDVGFPDRGAGEPLGELNYRFEYSAAWALENEGGDIGVATPDADYRVQRILRYLPEGRPAALSTTNAAYRLFSLAGPLSAGLFLALLFMLTDRWLRPSPRGDQALFESEIGGQPPELVEARRRGGGIIPFSFEAAIAGMAARKKVSIVAEGPATADSETPSLVRLTVDRSSLNPFEERLIDRLFGLQTTVTSAEIKERYQGREFDPDALVEDALKQVYPSRGEVRRPFWLTLHLGLIAAGLWYLVNSLLDHSMSDPMPIMAGLVPGGIFLSMWPKGSRPRPAPGIVILLAVLALGFLGAAIALSLNSPLGGPASLGLGLLSISHIAGYLARVPRPDKEDLAFEAARRWGLLELKKNRPPLRDSWVHSIQAMGGGRALNQWKRRAQERAGGQADMTDFTSLEPATSGPAFTGEPPRPPVLPALWGNAFRFDEFDDEDDEDEEGLDSSEE